MKPRAKRAGPAASLPTSGGTSKTAPRENGADALIRAARELLVERGPGYVTLTAVAKRARVNPALVKYHYGSKFELFSATLMHVLDEWAPQFVAIVNEQKPTAERLRARVELLIDLHCKDPYVYRLMQEQMLLGDASPASQRFREYMTLALAMNRKLLTEGFARNELRAVSPVHVNMLLLGMAQYFATARGLMEEFAGVRYTPEFIARYKREAVDMILHGLLAPAGRTPEATGPRKGAGISRRKI
jgi:AcrR family transcriptional regulator